MPPDLLQQLPSFGIAGLLFVMWWSERQERTRITADARDALRDTDRVAALNRHLLDALRANTEAVVALREELRDHRATQTTAFERLATQLARLADHPPDRRST